MAANLCRSFYPPFSSLSSLVRSFSSVSSSCAGGISRLHSTGRPTAPPLSPLHRHHCTGRRHRDGSERYRRDWKDTRRREVRWAKSVRAGWCRWGRTTAAGCCGHARRSAAACCTADHRAQVQTTREQRHVAGASASFLRCLPLRARHRLSSSSSRHPATDGRPTGWTTHRRRRRRTSPPHLTSLTSPPPPTPPTPTRDTTDTNTTPRSDTNPPTPRCVCAFRVAHARSGPGVCGALVGLLKVTCSARCCLCLLTPARTPHRHSALRSRTRAATLTARVHSLVADRSRDRVPARV